MEHRVLHRSSVSKYKGAPRLRGALNTRGFTLVELAVVVTIVAVLATIALVGYRRYMLNSHITEAQSMISGIKISQEDHKSEKGTYQDVGATSYCPTGSTVYNKKVAWDPTCSSGTAAWNTLAVHVEGPVQFGYMTSAGTNTKPTLPTDGSFVSGMPGTAVPNWYTITAKCDLDPTNSTLYTVLVGSSLDNRIFTNNPGE